MLKLRLLVSVGLERMKDETWLILVVVTPLRTNDAVSREEQLVLFCIETDEFWPEWLISELLMERHKHEDHSSSLIGHVSQRLVFLNWGGI